MKLMKYDLKNKFCLITGAAGLMGPEHARAILEINGNVILTDLNNRKLLQLQKKLKNEFKDKKIFIYFMDVTKINSIQKVSKNLKKKN